MYSLNKTKYLSTSEQFALYTHVSRIDTRDSILLMLAIKTGARAQELLNITQDDLSDETQSILIHGLKNSNDRELPVSEDLYTAVKSLCKEDPRVFPISYSRLVQIWHYYRPVTKKFHCLRHTFAIELYKKTKDVKLVQTALGHRNIQNSIVYMDYVFTLEEMRRIL